MVTFPENPYDGQTIVDETGTNGVIVWTWSAENNEWTCKEYGAQGELLIYTDQVLVRDNTEAPDALATPDQLSTQKDVNYWQAEQDKQIVQQTARVADTVDFSQNTVCKGYWTHQLPPEVELHPRPGEFWTNNNETDFGKVTQFKFNDSGLPGVNNPATLEGTRKGDYLLVQCNGTNDFGYYVVIEGETENVASQVIRTFNVKPFLDARYKGTTTEGVRHTVSTLRPVYSIVTDEQPVVSTRGIFWYRESDDHLFISNYADGFTGEGPQWTDLTASGGGGDYLPLTGGTMKGDIAMGGHKVTGIGDPKADSQAANKSYVDTRLMRTGGTQQKMEGILYLGGHRIAGVADPERSDDAATRGFVEEQIAAIPAPELELSTKQKMYLQGFYPWRVGAGSQINSPGDFLPKKHDYNVDLDPATWRYLYFSVFDAYGQDLAGKFMNHMDMDKQREMFVWFAREDGTKIFTYTGKMKCRDQNFEERFTVDIDASDKDLVTSSKYDTVPLEISRGEILWIKCSAWGN